MNFQIILNSRGRVSQLHNLLENLGKKTKHLDKLLVKVCYDDDDLHTQNYLATAELVLVEDYPFPKVEAWKCTRGNNLHTNLNMALDGNAAYYFVLNDDCEIKTENWDVIAFEYLNQFLSVRKDGIVLGAPKDTSCDKGGDYASFPIISRAGVQALGYFMPALFTGHGADVYINRVYNAVGRVCPLPFEIDHIGHNTLEAVNSPDLTQVGIRQISNLRHIDCYNCDITKDVRKLMMAIKNG